MNKNIWIDICHPPQAVFYIPIIRELERRGYSILITVQEGTESAQLLQNAGLSFLQIGRKYGRKKIYKAIGLIRRSIPLWQHVHRMQIQIAVSQGSPYQIAVARLLRIPTVVIGDNEKSEWFFIKFVQKCIYPNAFRETDIKVPMNRVFQFDGLKEEVYLGDFVPNPRFLAELKLDSNQCVATLRSPATSAYYHNVESEELLYKLITHLLKFPDIQIILLPRNKNEERHIDLRFHDFIGNRIFQPNRVLDGLNLIWHSDAVFSGGGTMIREAALLGVPAYSYFQGETLAVDRFLLREGKLRFIRNEDDISNISVQKRMKKSYIQKGNRLCGRIVDEILKTSNEYRCG